jgi:hypothetical protein
MRRLMSAVVIVLMFCIWFSIGDVVTPYPYNITPSNAKVNVLKIGRRLLRDKTGRRH